MGTSTSFYRVLCLESLFIGLVPWLKAEPGKRASIIK